MILDVLAWLDPAVASNVKSFRSDFLVRTRATVKSLMKAAPQHGLSDFCLALL
jgi:hypothetical protein